MKSVQGMNNHLCKHTTASNEKALYYNLYQDMRSLYLCLEAVASRSAVDQNTPDRFPHMVTSQGGKYAP